MASFKSEFSYGIYLILTIGLFSLSNAANVQLRTEKCDAVRYAYGSQAGFNRWDVPQTKIEGLFRSCVSFI